jgi:hypothetical protein
MKFFYLFLLFISLGTITYAIDPKLNPQASFGFVKNDGQIMLNNQQFANEILYRFAGNNLQVNLRKNGFSYELTKIDLAESELKVPTISTVRGHRVDLDFIGTNQNIPIVETNEIALPLFVSDKMNVNSTKRLHHFSRILYKNIYPFIDIEFLVTDNNFKYNFILHPGADVSLIQFKILGADKIQLNKKGNLDIYTSCGVIEERIPSSWCETKGKIAKQKFVANFVSFGDNKFGILSKEKFSNLTRVIDPVPYCSYVGGENHEYADALVVDDTGNIYFMGRTASATGISTPGSYQIASANTSTYDAFLTKFDKNGTILWATYYGGTNNEKPLDIKIDKQGNIVACGLTFSTNGIASIGASQTTSGGGQDGFICKFNPGGGLIWSTYFGFSSDDEIRSIAIDNSGDYYFSGTSKSTNTFSYPSIHQANNAGDNDAIMLKMTNAGIIKWASFFGGTAGDFGVGIAVDQYKNIYLAGSTYSSSGVATTGAYQTTQAGSLDMYLVKFDSSGTRLFGTYIGGLLYEALADLCLDKNESIIFVGQTGSTSGLVTSGAFQTNFAGGPTDVALGKFSSNGNVDFITYMGGPDIDFAEDLCLDNSNKIYILGYTASKSGIFSLNGYDTSFGGGDWDAFFTCFSNNGNREWSSYFGGESNDYGSTIDFSNNNDLIIGGYTNSATNIASIGAAKTTREGLTDNFILIYNLGAPISGPCTNPIKAGFTINKLIQCERDNQFVFTDTTTTSANATRIWDFGNGTFGSAQTETVRYLPVVDNKFTVRLTVTDGNCIDSAKRDVFLIRSPGTKTITGNILPRPGITETYTVPSSNGSSYKWVFESGQAVGTTFTNTIKIKWLTEDSVDLKVVETNGGGCTGDTNYLQVVIYDPTGMQELLEMGRIAVYPNPSNNYIYIEDITQSSMPFTLTDIYGKKVLEGIQNNGEAIDVSQLPAGIYLLQMGNYQGFVKLAIMH